MEEQINEDIHKDIAEKTPAGRSKIGWRFGAKWSAILLGFIIMSMTLFLIAFPITRRYSLVYVKRMAQFIGLDITQHRLAVGSKPLSPLAFSVHGIDVSHHNKLINWDRVKFISGTHDTISFVFIKATEGGSHVDTRFKYNWEFSKRTHIVRGAYHYYKPNIDPITQAQWFIQNVTLQKGDLPPVIDVEESRFGWGYSLENDVLVMVQRLQAYYEVKPIIYTSHNFYEIFFSSSKFAQYPFWIARYTFHHRLSTLDFWEFWQHSEKGTVQGIEGDVDVNVFAGSTCDLEQLTIGNGNFTPLRVQ